jgi:hypothetical protein
LIFAFSAYLPVHEPIIQHCPPQSLHRDKTRVWLRIRLSTFHMSLPAPHVFYGAIVWRSVVKIHQFYGLERKSSAGLITLSRPNALNTPNSSSFKEANKLLRKMDEDGSVGAIVITECMQVLAAGEDSKDMKDKKRTCPSHLALSAITQVIYPLMYTGYKSHPIAAASAYTRNLGI